MAKKFKDYTEVSESMMEGFTVAKVFRGINAEDSGMMIELEKKIGNVVIGIDVIYNPDHEEGETPFMVSEEYHKNVCKMHSCLENKWDGIYNGCCDQ